MKIRNPNYIDPVATFVAANKAAMQSWLAGQSGKEFVLPAEIRAAFPALADKLTDGMIHEIARALALEVRE